LQARGKVEALRQEELEFLGMVQSRDTEEHKEEKKREQNRLMKKNLQKEYDRELEENRIKLNKELRDSESKDIENEE